MKVTAARLVRHQAPLAVEEVELAAPGPGEVAVDMAFAGVNPVDRYRALGLVAPDSPLPRTLGTEGSGTVGDRRVLVRGHGLSLTRDGLWATRAVVPDEALIDLPEAVSLEAAAAMGVAGVTAWRALVELAQVGPDDRVLVLGASGGVGSIAVSIASGRGATVWGQTGNSDKAAWVEARGAARAVVAGAEDLAPAVADLAPTVVLDPLGGGFTGAAIAALRANGKLVLVGTSAGTTGDVPLQQLYRKNLTVFGYGGLIQTDEALGHHLRQALAALAEGRFEVPIDCALPLGEVNDALARIAERRLTGKVVLDLQA